MNSLWEKEDFELTVTKSLYSVYEGKHKRNKKVGWVFRPKDKEIKFIKRNGLYFAPKDRVAAIEPKIDIKNDGLGDVNSWCFPLSKNLKAISPDYRDAYLCMNWLIKKSWPKKYGLLKSGEGIPYLLYSGMAMHDGGIIWKKDFCTINPQTGKVYPRKFLCNCGHCYGHDDELNTVMAVMVNGFWQDRKHLWNVMASEGIAKATFGVYEEQIQSLFYARDLPTTATGRKRPILHWVASHRRRIKNGTHVKIKKHLRGINKFEMGGTLFEISRPVKKRAC
jgi:hypothetical protein